MEHELNEALKQLQLNNRDLAEMKASIETLKSRCDSLDGLVRESIMANVFHDSVVRSNWLKPQEICPGRWAAGYAFLYPLYRVLDEFHPKSILELGLGQTTTMTSSYAKAYPDIFVNVVEHDSEWISFFRKKHDLSSNVDICQLPIVYDGRYKDDDEVVSYKGFADAFRGQKFDLIIIDGPFGGLAKRYSRVDILSIFPDCLKDSFVLFIDDSQRAPERNTIKEIKNCLDQKKIKFAKGEYRGEKNTYIIVSQDNKFFCSM